MHLQFTDPTSSQPKEFDPDNPIHFSKLNVVKFHVSQKLRMRKAQLVSNNNWNIAKPGQWVQKGVCRNIPEINKKQYVINSQSESSDMDGNNNNIKNYYIIMIINH